MKLILILSLFLSVPAFAQERVSIKNPTIRFVADSDTPVYRYFIQLNFEFASCGVVPLELKSSEASNVIKLTVVLSDKKSEKRVECQEPPTFKPYSLEVEYESTNPTIVIENPIIDE